MKRREKNGDLPKIYETAIVMNGAEIGRDAVVGAFCFVAAGAKIGDGCRIQSHTSVWNGVTLEEDVFVGPAAVFTNVKRPRAEWSRAPTFDKTFVGKGAAIGAGAILVAPVTIGAYAMIGAGAVVTKDIPPHAVAIGNPAKITGYACKCGEQIASDKIPSCTKCTAEK